VFQIEFETDLVTLGATTYDLIQYDKFCGANAIIRENYFHDGYVTGMKLKSIGARVESNRFERTASWDIGIFAEQYYFEGSLGIRDIWIFNNTMIRSAFKYYPDQTSYVQGAISCLLGASGPGEYYNVKTVQYSNITIIKNTIIGASTTAITIKNTQNSVIQDTKISNPAALSAGYGIYFDAVTNITVDCFHVTSQSTHYKGDIGKGENLLPCSTAMPG